MRACASTTLALIPREMRVSEGARRAGGVRTSISLGATVLLLPAWSTEDASIADHGIVNVAELHRQDGHGRHEDLVEGSD